MSGRSKILKLCLWAAALFAFVAFASTASAVTAPNAGGDQTVDEDDSVTYTGTDASGTATSEGWIFDGNLVVGNPASWTFSTPGVYSASYWADDGAGSNNSDTISITVTDITDPSAAAGSDQSVNEDTVVTFDGSSSTDNDPNFASTGRYYWIFVDSGSSVSLNGQVQTYTMSTPGTYVVTLLVLDNAGNFGADTMVVTVADVTDPSAVIAGGSPQSFDEDTVVSFDASGTTDNDPNFGFTGSYAWTFTDGTLQTLTGSSATYTFAEPGSYTITLTVTDAAGNSATATATFDIDDVTDPTADWTISGGLAFDEDVSQTLDATTSSDNVAVSVYEWTIDFYGGSTTQYGSTTTYTWDTPGSFDVTLTVYDAAGNSNAQVQTVVVADVTAPTVVIAGGTPQTYDDGTSVSLDGTSSSDNDPNFASTGIFSWDIAGPVTATLSGPSQSFTFDTPGTYTVTLSVTDDAGNMGTDSITVNINDITAPTVSIASGPATLERFRSATHTGSASDDVAVTTSGWAFVENSVSQNISGLSLARSWAYTGSYTLTVWAADAAGNIATASMSFDVTADITPPSVSVSGPATGDNTAPIAFTGSVVTELDPACASSCSWVWTVTDRTGAVTSAATGTTTLSYTFQPGRNVVRLNVTDPSGNTGTQSRNVDIDELVSTNTVWNFNPLSLNWDVVIANGATLTIQNALITEPTLVTQSTITVANGRLIFSNSQLGTATGGPNGFILRGVPDPLVTNPTMVFYFNNSDIFGLRAPIQVTKGTLSATNSDFAGLRVANTGVIYGVDTNIFLTNVTVNSTAATTSYGVRSDFTSAITFGTTVQLRIDLATIRSTGNAIQISTTSLGGSVSVSLRDLTLQTTTTSYRGLQVAANGGTGDYTFDLNRVDGRLCPGGTIDATWSNRYANVVDWTIVDSNLSSTSSATAAYFKFQNTAADAFFDLSNVTITGANIGMRIDATNTAGGAPTFVVTNELWITMDDVHFDRNAGSGFYLYRQTSSSSSSYPNFLLLDMTVTDSTFNDNGVNGMYFYANYGSNSLYETPIDYTIRLTDVNFIGNGSVATQDYGINFEAAYTRTNLQFIMNRVLIDNNSVYGVRHYHTYVPSWGGVNKMGQVYFNLTDTYITANNYGMYFYEYYHYGQTNFTVNMLRSAVDNNRGYGVYWYTYYFQYYPNQGSSSSFTQVVWNLDQSSVSNNRGSYGLYLYVYYCYGYPSPSGVGACKLDLTMENSHIDGNGGYGVYLYGYYFIYNEGNMHVNVFNQSTIDDNAGVGLYVYCMYCNYGYYTTAGGNQDAELWVKILHSSVSRNGGVGLYVYLYYQYYGTVTSGIDLDDATFDANGGDGIYFFNQYAVYGIGITKRIVNSTFTNNNGNAIESSHWYMYQQCTNFCLLDRFDNNLFKDNAQEDIRLGYGSDYYRAGGLFDLAYTNNLFDGPNKPILSSYPTVSCTGCGQIAYGEKINISGNTILNASAAPIDFTLDPAGGTGPGVEVIFNDNYIADAGDTTTLSLAGQDGARHQWTVTGNTILRNSGNALKLHMPNSGGGNTGSLTFERNTFQDTGGTAFVLDQSNIQMTGFVLRDSSFINQRKAIELAGVNGRIDNITLQGSLQSDIELADGTLEVHNTAIDQEKLVPLGSASTFNVYFYLKLYVRWAGSDETAIGSIVEVSDALGVTFFVGAISDDEGLPRMELWSYSKSASGVLGRSPFEAFVSFFEISQLESIDLPSDRTVTVYLRDEIHPTLVVSSPRDGYSTRDDFIRVEGTAYDSQSGFEMDANDPQFAARYVQVSTDNVNWNNVHVQASDVFKVQFDYTLTGLTEAVDTIYIRVMDEAQNVFVRQVAVTIDWTPPLVTLLEAVPSITNAQTVHVAAETEVGSQVLVNGLAPPEIFIRPDGVHMFFQMDIPLLEGPNTVTVMAIDALRNQGNATFFVLVDRQKPYLAVLTPEVDALVSTTTVQVTGQASDRNGVTVTVNGMDAQVVNGNFSIGVPLVGDFNRIEVIATDAAGNRELILRDVRFDNTPPWINVQSPPQFALLGSPEVNVVGIVEPGSRLILNDELVDAPTGAFARLILLQEGENAIRLVAIDPAGNERTQIQTVTVDTVKPTITIDSPDNETLWNKATVVVSGSVSDDHAVAVLIDGALINLNTDNTFSVPVALFEGTNFITVQSFDGAGNLQTRVITVIRDTTAPFVVPQLEGTYLDGVVTKTRDLSVTVSGFAERGSVVEACVEDILGEEDCTTLPLSGAGEFRTFVDLIPLTANDITVRATDAAGNTVSRTFAVTQAPPEVIAPEGTSPAVYAMFGVGIAALGVGAYLLMFSRRGRGGQPVEIAGPEPGYMTQPMGDDSTMVATPEVAADAGDMNFDVAGAPPEVETAAAVPDAEVPAAPSRNRPMRRRPTAVGDVDSDGTSLTGMGAEDEAMPGESHQDQTKEG